VLELPREINVESCAWQKQLTKKNINKQVVILRTRNKVGVMNNWMFLVVIFIGVSSVHGQYTIHDWYGAWKGELNIMRLQDTLMTVPMSLEISKMEIDSAHNWVITYTMKDKPIDRRAYTLKEKNGQGQFILDENNGITMPMDMHGNALFSIFDVMDNRLISRIELHEDYLIYAIEIASLKEEMASPADTIMGNPAVYSWPVNSRHRAILNKTNK